MRIRAKVTVRVEGIKKTLNLSEILAITAYWARTNKRRLSLIEKKMDKTINQKEEKRLEQLQKLAGYKGQLVR